MFVLKNVLNVCCKCLNIYAKKSKENTGIKLDIKRKKKKTGNLKIAGNTKERFARRDSSHNISSSISKPSTNLFVRFRSYT